MPPGKAARGGEGAERGAAARKPGERVRASLGRWALPARCLCQGGASVSRVAAPGMGRGQQVVRGQGNLEGLCFRKMAGGEEDEGMGGEQEPEVWRPDRARW